MSEGGSSVPGHRADVQEKTGKVTVNSTNQNLLYEPLADASAYIRLFRIKSQEKSTGFLSLELISASLAEEAKCVRYTTLSYRWGPVFPSRTIWVNGQRLQIRWNLYEFLLHLDESEASQLLWADAICINQEDVLERGLQVGIMGRIFQQSDMVIAWLEMPSRNTENVVDLSKKYSQWLINQSYPFEFSREDIEALYAFSLRAYWMRTWIIQELTLPRKRVLACGTHRISLSNLQQAAITAYATARGPRPSKFGFNRRLPLGSPVESRPQRLETTSELLRTITNSAMVAITTSQDLTLAELLHFHRHSVCSDPRDKVYALRALASDVNAKTLSPDYRIDVRDFYLQVLAVCGTTSQGFRDELRHILSISYSSLLDYTESLETSSHFRRGEAQAT